MFSERMTILRRVGRPIDVVAGHGWLPGRRVFRGIDPVDYRRTRRVMNSVLFPTACLRSMGEGRAGYLAFSGVARTGRGR